MSSHNVRVSVRYLAESSVADMTGVPLEAAGLLDVDSERLALDAVHSV